MAGYLGKTRIIAYQVQDTGFFDPVVFKKKNLKSTEVFIFVDEGGKELWIWIGKDADVRTRFISSTVASEIRGLYGLKLRVRSADQTHEPEDFWKCLDLLPEEEIGSMETKDSFDLVPPEPPIPEVSKKKTLKKPVEKIAKNAVKKRKKASEETTKSLPEFTEAKPSLVTTPPCPRCDQGHLIPYSQMVNVTARSKRVLPFARWMCSNCGFSPKENDS